MVKSLIYRHSPYLLSISICFCWTRSISSICKIFIQTNVKRSKYKRRALPCPLSIVSTFSIGMQSILPPHITVYILVNKHHRLDCKDRRRTVGSSLSSVWADHLHCSVHMLVGKWSMANSGDHKSIVIMKQHPLSPCFRLWMATWSMDGAYARSTSETTEVQLCLCSSPTFLYFLNWSNLREFFLQDTRRTHIEWYRCASWSSGPHMIDKQWQASWVYIA